MALMEQNANTQPGRLPSGIAHNAYLGSIPRTFEQEREGDILGEMDRRFAQSREDDRKRQSVIDDAEGAATIRNFETRRGVRDADAPQRTIKPFTAENFGPMASHGPAPAESATAPEPPMRTIRRFTSEGTKPVDPDAAMGARDRSRLDPRVMAAEAQAAGDVAIAGMKGKPADGPSPYARERGIRNLQSIDELMDRVGMWTAGPGSALSAVPGTDARDFAAELDTLKANIAFGELTAMREASKTGGALGAVSEKEMKLLESALGALDPGQSPENLKRQFQKVRESITRWDSALAGGGKAGGGNRRQVGRFVIEE
jgi:hypothetical protein